MPINSASIEVFLSCSFDPTDKNVVDYFAALCRSLDMKCVNVSTAYAATPPEVAREMISKASVLIAIATKRIATTAGDNLMPRAVEEEMSIAFGLQKPILLFVDAGVNTSLGFVRNYCTSLSFDRGTLYSPDFLERACRAIHEQKLRVLSPEELMIHQEGQDNLYAEKSLMLADLVESGSGYIWKYSIIKRYRFTARFTEKLRGGAWPGVPATAGDAIQPMRWEFSYIGGSKAFVMTPHLDVHKHDRCELHFTIDPVPDANDTLEYALYFESPTLSPIFEEDIAEHHAGVEIDGQYYKAYEGIVLVARTEAMTFQFRIPKTYNVRRDAIRPFVGRYANKVENLVPGEMKRMAVDMVDFGGNTQITLNTTSPWLGHIYGIAWNPPKRTP